MTREDHGRPQHRLFSPRTHSSFYGPSSPLPEECQLDNTHGSPFFRRTTCSDDSLLCLASARSSSLPETRDSASYDALEFRPHTMDDDDACANGRNRNVGWFRFPEARKSRIAATNGEEDEGLRRDRFLWRSPVQWVRAAHSSLRALAIQQQQQISLEVLPPPPTISDSPIPANNSTTASGTAVIPPPPPPTTDSVHLKLNSETLPKKDEEKDAPQPPPPPQSSGNNATTLKVHTYVHPRTGKTWKAINTAKKKFISFLQYNHLLGTTTPVITTKEYKFFAHRGGTGGDLQAKQQHQQQERLRAEWRQLWKQRRLLVDRTEFLAVYPSDTSSTPQQQQRHEGLPTARRGGFTDLLHLYRERLVAILEDEKNDSTPQALVGWLQEKYGAEATQRLLAENLKLLPEREQLAELKRFLEWFRSYFPYFYDRCSLCGASNKEDQEKDQNNHECAPSATNGDGDDDEEDEKGFQTFMGYVYPAHDELKGKASRTELYHCHKCRGFTRFPRFNSAWHIMECRRGRCGEYSMLLYRFLRALKHETRWVVDWADHVWAEVYLGGGRRSGSRWVHLDPCEAAVDENLIYQGWGKKQTYILGFFAPMNDTDFSHTPMIEDITASYTSDPAATIQQRRGDEARTQVDDAIRSASQQLERKVAQMMSSSSTDRWPLGL